MILARIIEPVWATIADPELSGARLLLAMPVTPDGTPVGKPLVAVDRVDAGPGDLVVILREGGSARMMLGQGSTPVQAVVVAVVDGIESEPSKL